VKKNGKIWTKGDNTREYIVCTWRMSSNLQNKKVKVKTSKIKLEDTYLIIGKLFKLLNPKDFGLENKVAKDEVLISVPKELIDNKRKW